MAPAGEKFQSDENSSTDIRQYLNKADTQRIVGMPTYFIFAQRLCVSMHVQLMSENLRRSRHMTAHKSTIYLVAGGILQENIPRVLGSIPMN